ncbi:MAG: polysaccharide biosynthesis/export family protein [Kiritimatiellia bacterium]
MSNAVKTIEIWIILLLLAGCSRQDFSRIPTPGWPGGAAPAPVDREKQLENILVDWQAQRAGRNEDYRVGPGDEIEIQIFALDKPGENSVLKREIAKDGSVSLKWVGELRVSGMNLREVEDAIRTAYGEKYLKNPQVGVNIVNYGSVPVVVTGAVNKPGIYCLTSNKSTLLEVLALAGGLKADAGNELLLISESMAEPVTGEPSTNEAPVKKIVPVDIARLIDQGDFQVNLEVGANDIVTVRPNVQQVVYVLGYVQRPGAFELKGGQKVDMVKGVALAGGLSPSARAENSYLVRETEQGQKVIPVNLAKMASGDSATEYLQAGDTLVVGSGFIARLAEFVRPSVGAGFNYAPVP